MWLLDYDGALLMRLPVEETDAFLADGFYKLFLRRYVRESLPGFLRFKQALTYLDYKKIIELFSREAGKRIQSFTVSTALRDYIDAREMHLDSRYRLGAELKKHDPKLSERYEQYKKIVDSRMVRPLRESQMWDSFFMCAMQKSADFSVPGSGKTASVLGVYAYLSIKGLVKRILVICPKNAFGSWMEEFTACFGVKEPMHVLNIHNAAYKGTRDRRRALEYESGGCNLILVNYESVGQLNDLLKTLAENRTLLVFDEVHKVKRIEGEYASHALEVAHDASYVAALTGTPLPNAYTDIYNLLHILFPYEYEEFFGFTPALLRKPTAQDVQMVNDKLQPFFCRTTKDQLGVPRANPDTMVFTEADMDENRLLKILSMKYKGNKLALMIRILQLESNPHTLLESLNLRDFEYLLDDCMDDDEIDYADYSGEIRTLIEGCATPPKFQKCVDLTEKLAQDGKPVILWCIFIDSIHRLSAELERRGVRCRCVYGDVSLEERQQFLDNFRNGQIQVLLTNPHTLAESVSLHSVCHDAVYFEYSYNLVHLLQSKDRIHRLGLPEGQYTQYYYLKTEYQTEHGPWSMDQAIYDRLKEKEHIMLDAIDNHVLETMPTSEEDLEIIFAKLYIIRNGEDIASGTLLHK